MNVPFVRCGVFLCAVWFGTIVMAAGANSGSSSTKLNQLYVDATELEKEGNLNAAEAKMTEAIKLAPEEASAYFNRALFRYRLGRHKEAEEDADTYINLAEDNDDGLELRARIRLMLQNYSGALADATSALWENEDREEARLTRALALMAQKKHQQALADLEVLTKKNPENSTIMARRVECELALGRNSEARAALRTLIKKHPEDAWVHSNLALAEFRVLNFSEAIRLFERAETLKVSRAHTQKMIGYCRFAMADHAGAIEALRQSIAATSTPYACLVLHLAIRNANRSVSESPLRDAMQSWDSTWAQALGRYLLDEMSDRELVALAKSAQDQETRDEQLCEAYFYIGQTRLLQMDSVAAEVFFERVLGTRQSTFFEYTFARAELKRL